MRGEDEFDRFAGLQVECTFHLWLVSMLEDLVGLRRFVHCAELEPRLYAPTSTGYSRHRVDDDPGRFDEACLEKRGKGQDRRRWIAPGRCDTIRVGDLRSVKLRQAVHPATQLVRIWMIGTVCVEVPLRRVKTEIAAEIDDAYPSFEQRHRRTRRCTMRKGEECEIDVGDGLRVVNTENPLAPSQMWVDGTERLAR